MPIGKNAIKRVVNNGYSSVKSDAPDMENSTVAEVQAPIEKPKAKKATPRTSGEEKIKAARIEVERIKAESAKPKKQSQKKQAPAEEKATEEAALYGDYISIGEQMPIYLL